MSCLARDRAAGHVRASFAERHDRAVIVIVSTNIGGAHGRVPMRRDEALALLGDHREELRRFGIKSLGIFGSVARDEAGPASDVDLLVEFAIPAGLFELIRLQRYLESLFGRRVDLATPNGLRDQFRARILRDTVYAA
jgi:uncharacterized protein